MQYKLIEGIYRVNKFDEAKAECRKFIEEVGSYVPLTNTKEIRKARAEIRKKRDEIATVRIQCSKAMLAEFQSQCKELEGMLDEEDKRLKAALDALTKTETSEQQFEPVTISCTILHEDTLAKAVKALEELGLTVQQKKKGGK